LEHQIETISIVKKIFWASNKFTLQIEKTPPEIKVHISSEGGEMGSGKY
jgi:hypothetical protein